MCFSKEQPLVQKQAWDPAGAAFLDGSFGSRIFGPIRL